MSSTPPPSPPPASLDIMHSAPSTPSMLTPPRENRSMRRTTSSEGFFESGQQQRVRARTLSSGDMSSFKERTSRTAFDLSASLYKRRGGMGWNADRNWILRWFTLHGSVLCYYDAADMQSADPSRPRGRINLAKEDISVDMHLSNKAKAQTEFLLTVHIYGLGGKKKWEMCCKSKAEQLEWFEALRKFDGKPAFMDASDVSPKKKKNSRLESITYTETSPFSLKRSESITYDDKGSSDLLTTMISILDGTVSTRTVLSIVGLNLAAYMMRVGSQPVFWVALFVANFIVLTSSPGEKIHLKNTPQDLTRTDSEEEPPIVNIMAAGSTMNRATPTKQAVVDTIEENGMASAAAIRACAAAGKEDYMAVPHSYWNANGSTFNLRIGPNYKKHKAKAPSGPPLYDLYAMDLVKTKSRLKNASNGFHVPDIKGITDVGTGHPDVPPMIVFNAGIPSEEPGLLRNEDGPSYVVILYLVISQRLRDELKDLSAASPAVKLFVEWCKRAETDADFRGRFKAMCVLDDIESLGLPSFISGYNGKPALITKSGTFTRYEKYIEMSTNVHVFAYIAKKSLFSLQSKFPSFILNVGFTIEGRNDSELPEVLLGGCRCIKLDLNKAVAPGTKTNDASNLS